MFWEEYVKYYSRGNREIAQKLNRIRRIIEKNNLFGMTGAEYQWSEWYRIIEIETGITFTCRAWGNLMAALMNTLEGKRKYDYIDFAW
jgi:hypothetical protein